MKLFNLTKVVVTSLIALSIAGCGGSNANIRILTSENSAQNPFTTLTDFNNYPNSALFFVFWTLKPGFSSMDAANIDSTPPIWYPDPYTSSGLKPNKSSFDLTGQVINQLQSGKFYKVELWGNVNYTKPCDCVQLPCTSGTGNLCSAYSHGDCPIKLDVQDVNDTR